MTRSKTIRMSCNQCEALMINGVFCHETGCPNSHSRYDVESGDWISQRKCFDCGCMVDADDPCCSAPIEDEWSGSLDPDDPDNYWIDDNTGERVSAITGERE